MKYFLICVFLVLTSFQLTAQKVGLVLSGGAAKGLAHVGVLKALEENDIPVDYIVGTSMGGIIGGIYAAGISPHQIETIVLSDRFLKWINGVPETGYNYYYHKSHLDPGFLRLDLSLDSTLNVQFNTSIASDASLNFALAEHLAQASAISGNNFDSLFIPLRVVAADIFTQNEVILSKGLLSDALRATQTVPFFYTPIRVDGRYLYDGGVYNNFPVDVAESEFNPEVIIGVNVSTKIFNDYPYENDDALISHSLLYLLLDKSDPARLSDGGIFIQPDLKGYTSFDFRSAKSLIDSGYVQTMRQMDEIKEKISARRSCDEVMEKRNAFHYQSKPFVFDEILFQGFNQKQSNYIKRVFGVKPSKPSVLFYNDIKRGYFRLIAEDYFNNVYPNILYDTSGRTFKLQLTRRPQKNFQVDFGGVIATRDISNIYLGLNLYDFNRVLTHMSLSFQTGNFFKSARARSRFDFPAFRQFYVEPYVFYNSYNYLENNNLLQDERTTVLTRLNRKAGVNMGWPVGNRFKAVIGAEGFNNNDRYSNSQIFVSTDTLDNLKLKGFKSFFSLSANSLNRKQYANAGGSFNLTGSYFNVTEYYQPGSTSILNEEEKNYHHWLQIRLSAEQYFNRGFFKPGYMFEAVFSNQPVFRNYYGTIINTPSFRPFQDSPTLLLENYRSFTYLAGGLRNVFVLKSKLDLRLEGYLFKPLDYLYEDANQEASKGSDLTKIYIAASGGLVFHSPIGPVSLSLNYYDDEQSQFGILLHAGFLLFDKHSLE